MEGVTLRGGGGGGKPGSCGDDQVKAAGARDERSEETGQLGLIHQM